MRTDQIARLLVETDLPVAKIADLLGFPDMQHIARYFHADKHISPVAYRKAHGRPARRCGVRKMAILFREVALFP